MNRRFDRCMEWGLFSFGVVLSLAMIALLVGLAILVFRVALS